MKAGNEGAAPDQCEAAQAEGQAANGASRGVADLLLIAGLTLVWGCNWPFIKIALSEAPVGRFPGRAASSLAAPASWPFRRYQVPASGRVPRRCPS